MEQSLNDQLIELYSKYAERFIELDRRLFCAEREDGNLGIPHSAPQLISLSGEWENCKGEKFSRNWEDGYNNSVKKVLFVGQDPYYWYKFECDRGCLGLDWPKDTSADDFVGRFSVPYLEFNMGRDNNGPFWNFIHSLYDDSNEEHFYLYANLFKVGISTDSTRARLDGSGKYLSKFLDKQYKRIGLLFLLKREIEILRPDVIIFLTGHNFDDVIYNIFRNQQYSENVVDEDLLFRSYKNRSLINYSNFREPYVDDHKVLAKLDLGFCEDLNCEAYRCYHPHYLHFHKDKRLETINLLKKILFEKRKS